MEVTARKSRLDGTVIIPASKSHTIRALIISALAGGESAIRSPLDSLDTRSAARAIQSFGAEVGIANDIWTVNGVGGKPRVPDDIIDVGNSGTTLYMIAAFAALADGWTVITGDAQIRRRTAGPLIEALNPLGAEVYSTRGNGLAPLIVRGPLRGGASSVAGISSQYVSALLLACPLALGDTDLAVTVLNERPYVEITLNWLAEQGMVLETDAALSSFRIPGNQTYHPFDRRIPADFSSAAFPLCAGILSGGTVLLRGLEMDDPQGDKEIIPILRRMGADIRVTPDGISVSGGQLRGTEIDMNAIPDAIPMMAACACFAGGTTVLHNVPQARIKETDRIAVMAAELTKLGADIRELPDGMIIRGTGLRGGRVSGHGDHRVVMALTVAGLAADGPVTVDTAEAAGVTYPGFWDAMQSLGAIIERRGE